MDVVELERSSRVKRKQALRGRNHAEGWPGGRIDDRLARDFASRLVAAITENF